MANFNLSGLLGGMFPMMQLEGLDDEELRLMEELRASGAYVPQVREQNPFAYGAGGRRAEDLAAARQAMQPAMQGRMQDVVQARGEQERNRMAMEAFNRQQQIAEQLRQKRIQDEARRQQLMGMQQEIADQSSADYRSAVTSGNPILEDFDKYVGKEYYDQNIGTQMAPRDAAELTVLQQDAAAPETKRLQLEEATASADLSNAVRAQLPPDYAKTLADKQVVTDELKVLLDRQRLNVARQFGDRIGQATGNNQLKTLDQEALAIEGILNWFQTPEGKQYLDRGAALGSNYRNVLEQLKIQLLTARAALTRAEQSGNATLRDIVNRNLSNRNSNIVGPPRRMPILDQGQFSPTNTTNTVTNPNP